MTRLAPLMFLMTIAWLHACSRSEPGSCEHWMTRLTSETDERAAVAAVAEKRCAGAAEKLAARLPDSPVPVDIVLALRALGPTEASTAAVSRALLDERAGSAAIETLVGWGARATLPAVKAALVAPGTERRRGALLDGALTLAGEDSGALVPELAALVGADPEAHGMEVTRKAAELLENSPVGALAEARVEVSGALVQALLLPLVQKDPEVCRSIRVVLARVGVVDAEPLLAALRTAETAKPLIADALCDTGTEEAAAAVVAHALRVVGSDEQATPRRLLDSATVAAALHPTADVLAPALTAVAEPGARAEEAARMLGIVGGEAAREALWQRAEAGAGAARAAAVAALAMAVERADLERWDKVVAKSPSLLVRDAATQAGPAAAIAAVRACGDDGGCWVATIERLVPALGRLDAELAAARAAWSAATLEIEGKLGAAAKAFHEEHGEGDTASPEAAAAMQRLRALRDEEYAAVAPLRERLDGLEGTRATVVRALRATDRAKLADETAKAATAAVFEAAKGEALLDVRSWAAVHLERVAGAGDRDRLVGLAGARPSDGPALHLLALARRLGDAEQQGEDSL